MATSRTRTVNTKPPAPVVPDLEEEDEGSNLTVVDDDDEGGTEAAAQTGNAVEDSVESLREQLAREKAAREDAEARAQQAQSGMQGARRQITDTRLQVLDNALSKEAATKTEIKRKIAEAKEQGNYDDEVDLIDQLQTVNQRVHQINLGKNELERQQTMEKEFAENPVEAYVAPLSPRAKEWVRAHPEVVTDATKRDALENAHGRALRDGYREGSSDYFGFIEEQLGYREREQQQEPEAEREPETRRAQQRAPAAPPSRGNPGNGSNSSMPDGVTDLGNGRYKLRGDLRDAARIAGLTDTQYLNSLLEVHKEGRLTQH